MFVLLLVVNPVFSAFCGSSTIPYRFEVLQDGKFSLGCARPSCFGWDGTTGSWASNDHAFAKIYDNQEDGFLRNDFSKRPKFNIHNPDVPEQINLGCLVSSSCAVNQWAGGLVHNLIGGPPTLLCCNYPPLIQAEYRGVAVVLGGQFVMGGEVATNGTLSHFDYLRNIQPITRFDGQIYGYNAEIGRMRCTDPPPVAEVASSSSRRYQAQYPYRNNQPGYQYRYNPYSQRYEYYQEPYYYYYTPQEQTSSYFCFAADSKVTLIDGSKRRMDALKETDWVVTPSEDMRNVTAKPLKGWLHRLPNAETEFVVILTESGKTIKLTPRHFIYKTDCSNFSQPEITTADQISIGNCLLAVDENNKLQPSVVIHIGTVRQKGIYAPLTYGGMIVVDDVAASCMSDVAEQHVTQTMYPNFVQCDKDEMTCSLKESIYGLALEIAKIAVPRA